MTRDIDEPDEGPDLVAGPAGRTADGRHIAPVPWGVLGAIAAVGGFAAFATTRVVELVTGTAPELPWSLPVALAVAAGGVAVLAWTTHRRVHVEGRWVAAQRGIRLLALGRTAVLAGAFVAGFGLVFASMFAARSVVEVSLVRTVVGAGLVFAGAGLVFAGRALERACHIPDDGTDPPRAPSGESRDRRLR